MLAIFVIFPGIIGAIMIILISFSAPAAREPNEQFSVSSIHTQIGAPGSDDEKTELSGRPSTRVNPLTLDGPRLVTLIVMVNSVLTETLVGAETEIARLALGLIVVVSVADLLFSDGLMGEINEAVFVNTPLADSLTLASILKDALPAGLRLTSVLILPVFEPFTAQLEPLDALHSQVISVK